jgi:hypothetical protein
MHRIHRQPHLRLGNEPAGKADEDFCGRAGKNYRRKRFILIQFWFFCRRRTQTDTDAYPKTDIRI